MKARRIPYKVGETVGQYIILERVRRIGKNTKFRVQCLVCNGIIHRFSNKFEKNHVDCK